MILPCYIVHSSISILSDQDGRGMWYLYREEIFIHIALGIVGYMNSFLYSFRLTATSLSLGPSIYYHDSVISTPNVAVAHVPTISTS